MDIQYDQAVSHAQHGHIITFELLPNGRTFWACHDCQVDGSYEEEC